MNRFFGDEQVGVGTLPGREPQLVAETLDRSVVGPRECEADAPHVVASTSALTPTHLPSGDDQLGHGNRAGGGDVDRLLLRIDLVPSAADDVTSRRAALEGQQREHRRGKDDLTHQRFFAGASASPPAPAQEAEQAEAQDEDPQAGGSAATNAAAAPRATVRDLDQRPWAGVARAIDGGDLQEEVE